MRKSLIFLAKLFFSLILVSAIVSCEKEEGGGNSGNSTTNNTINAKWKVSDNTSPYTSFEFNKDGSYIVTGKDVSYAPKTKPTQISNISFFGKGKISSTDSKSRANLSSVYFGTYKIEGNTITLSDFGTMEIISISDKEFSFTFTPLSTGVKSSYLAVKVNESIPSSNRTDMLCRTWKFLKATVDVENMAEEDIEYYQEVYGNDWKTVLEQSANEEAKGMTIVFSKAGTYFINFEDDSELSSWKWANTQETQIYYSFDNWEDDWSENIATIVELKSSSLVIGGEGINIHLVIK